MAVTEQQSRDLALVAALLAQALSLADQLGMAMLGAKIDDALVCAREIGERL